MKGKINFFCLLMLIVFSGCSSDDSGEVSNNGLLKVMIYGNGHSTFIEYDKGLMRKVFNHFPNGILEVANYEYDYKGRLSSTLIGGQKKTYKYDNKNRLIKEVIDGVGDCVLFNYLPNKIVVTKQHGFSKKVFSELHTDGKGRIIKIVRIEPSEAYKNSSVAELKYDHNNNIVKIVYRKDSNGAPNRAIEYSYDNKKNPIYYSGRSFYDSLYYLRSIDPISVDVTSSNNLVSTKFSESYPPLVSEFVYNVDNYPISQVQPTTSWGGLTSDNDKTLYEYY